MFAVQVLLRYRCVSDFYIRVRDEVAIAVSSLILAGTLLRAQSSSSSRNNKPVPWRFSILVDSCIQLRPTTGRELDPHEVAASPLQYDTAHALRFQQCNFELRGQLDTSRDAELRACARKVSYDAIGLNVPGQYDAEAEDAAPLRIALVAIGPRHRGGALQPFEDRT
jgi:hypothetical protein